MNVFVLDPIHPKAMDLLAREVHAIRWDDPRADRWPEEADGIIVRVARIGAAELERAQRLRVVGKHGVGVDNIDLEAARRKGVRVVNTPGINAEAVAELTVGLALAVARRIPLADRLTRQGQLQRATGSFQGVELQHRRLGVVGLGHIGSRVAEVFHAAFQMEVAGYDPHLPEDRWAVLQSRLSLRRSMTLKAVLSESDVVTVHVPLSPATRRLIGPQELSWMKPKAILVNTSRGGVCDESALYDALTEGRLGGAASDVFEREPPDPGLPLLRLDRFVATPHIGAATEETFQRMGRAVVEEVLAALADRPLRWAVV